MTLVICTKDLDLDNRPDGKQIMAFFTWLESSGFAMYVKEVDSLLGYNVYLVSHALGMAVLVGLSAMVSLRILGLASHLPLAPMESFFPLMFAGFWLNAVSGAVLFIAYPVKAVTNPVFFVKMTGVVLAVVLLHRLRRQAFGGPVNSRTAPVPTNVKIMAGALLCTWWGTITAGRLLAYHGVAGVERGTSVAVLIVSGVMLLVGYAGYAAARSVGGSRTSGGGVRGGIL